MLKWKAWIAPRAGARPARSIVVESSTAEFAWRLARRECRAGEFVRGVNEVRTLLAEPRLSVLQQRWLNALVEAFPSASVRAELDDWSDDGAMTVSLTEDGATHCCWVSTDGEMVGNWL